MEAHRYPTVLYQGNLWELSRRGKLARDILSIQGNLALFPKDESCLAPVKRSYLVVRKMSRPFGMFFGLGEDGPSDHSQASRCRCEWFPSRFARGTSQKT